MLLSTTSTTAFSRLACSIWLESAHQVSEVYWFIVALRLDNLLVVLQLEYKRGHHADSDGHLPCNLVNSGAPQSLTRAGHVYSSEHISSLGLQDLHCSTGDSSSCTQEYMGILHAGGSSPCMLQSRQSFSLYLRQPVCPAQQLQVILILPSLRYERTAKQICSCPAHGCLGSFEIIW